MTPVSLHPLISKRWSPRAFDSRPLSPETLAALLEAARWAPSSANEQPWRFVEVGREDDAREPLLAALSPGNRRWAERAPVLMVVAARALSGRTGRPNPHAWHDAGLATAQLLTQATALGIGAHVMGGFDPQVARDAVGIPEGFDPVSVIAIGFVAPAETLPDDLRERERAPRVRLPLREIAFAGRFGRPFAVPDEEPVTGSGRR
jgi:nitroreductase